jgi:hypothetical protein
MPSPLMPDDCAHGCEGTVGLSPMIGEGVRSSSSDEPEDRGERTGLLVLLIRLVRCEDMPNRSAAISRVEVGNSLLLCTGSTSCLIGRAQLISLALPSRWTDRRAESLVWTSGFGVVKTTTASVGFVLGRGGEEDCDRREEGEVEWNGS